MAQDKKINSAGKLQNVNEKQQYQSSADSNGIGTPSKAEQAVNKYSDDPERDKNAMRETGQLVRKKNNYIEIPKKEYAELCSSVRTRYADKIPAKGQILFGNNYYQFKYNKQQERIVYTFKLRIAGNEKAINYYWENFDNE